MFSEMINSFKKSITSFGAKGISAGNTRLIKILEHLNDRIDSSDSLNDRKIKDLGNLCELRDYAFQEMIKDVSEKLDKQQEWFKAIAIVSDKFVEDMKSEAINEQ